MELGNIETNNFSCVTEEDIHLEKIDGNARNVILRTTRNIYMREKVDGNSSAKIEAGGSISIGQKVDGSSEVDLKAGGDITILQKIDGHSTVTLECAGKISIGQKVDGASVVRWRAADAHWGYQGIKGGSEVTRF